MTFPSTRQVRLDKSALFKPRKKISVAESARRYVNIRTSSGGVSSWSSSVTPYMVEPMNVLASREYEACIFVGPAQCGKTQALIDGWVGYMAACDPSDMMIVQTSHQTARDFSKRRIDRLHSQSPKLKTLLNDSRWKDNTFDKIYKAGNILSISWPTVNQLSGKAIKYIAVTDYDRMPDDIDGEGSVFYIVSKRTTTFQSRGMTLVESSPGFDYTDPAWKPKTPHEGPPSKGIFSLYNIGDLRRYYWQCGVCDEYYMQDPMIDGFSFETRRDKHDIIIPQLFGEVGVICTKCGSVNLENNKRRMVNGGRWVREGMFLVKNKIEGEPRQSNIASFWLHGAAAAFQSWRSIVKKYLQARYIYEATSSEQALKAVANVDMGCGYIPMACALDRDPRVLEKRSEDIPKRSVPPGVRFLLAAVDVQKEKYVVQVMGIGISLESWVIDRFDIRWSGRKYRNEEVPVNPAGRIEDWNLITKQVINQAYPLSDGSGRYMRIFRTCCDTGGREGVTERAYDYWRNLRRKRLSKRLILVKGEKKRRMNTGPRVKVVYPDNTTRKRRGADARGEIPLVLVDTTQMKDAISADLSRDEPGPGYMHFPDWLGSWFYRELSAERRTDAGWVKPNQTSPNEALDLLGYVKGVLIYLDCEKIDWNNPPLWAETWEKNSEVVDKIHRDNFLETTDAVAKPKKRRENHGLGNAQWNL